jgi:putative thioredoxin
MIETIESEFIHEGNADNFSSMVINNSSLGPVLVNFWSRKAGPCLRQYPVLDKLVHEYSGRLLLINIDTEKEIVIPKDYGIASVPTLKLFRFGEVTATLYGYQDESDLKKLIDKYVVRDSDKIIEQAIKEYSQNKQNIAYQLLSDAILEDQINPRLPLTICKLLKFEKRYDDALNLINSLPDDLKNDSELLNLSNQLFFISIYEKQAGDFSDYIDTLITGDQNDLSELKILSAYYVIENQFELALQSLEKIISIKFDFDEAYARVAMLKIFKIIGDEHSLTQQYRQLLLKYTH